MEQPVYQKNTETNKKYWEELMKSNSLKCFNLYADGNKTSWITSEWSAIRLRIWEASGSNLGAETSYPD
jgi:hypothetical protein